MTKGIIVPIVGATIFASAPKFTKGVGQAIRNHFAERKNNKIERKLNELMLCRDAVRNHKSECEKFSLKRREKRSPTKERFYQDSVSAARNQVYAARIECMECWRFLEKRDALPINTVTRKPWEDFDEYLKYSHDQEQMYA